MKAIYITCSLLLPILASKSTRSSTENSDKTDLSYEWIKYSGESEAERFTVNLKVAQSSSDDSLFHDGSELSSMSSDSLFKDTFAGKRTRNMLSSRWLPIIVMTIILVVALFSLIYTLVMWIPMIQMDGDAVVNASIDIGGMAWNALSVVIGSVLILLLCVGTIIYHYRK